MTSPPRGRWLLFVFLGSLSACLRQEGALLVELTAEPSVRADCLKVSLYDGDAERQWVVVRREPDQSIYTIAVNPSADLPRSPLVEGSGWVGDCDDEASLQLNLRAEKVPAVFTPGVVERLSIRLEAPPLSADGDRDGYRAGVDCEDGDAAVHPGAPERCELETDADCDGQVGCADSACADQAPCSGPPDRLAFTGLPASVEAGACLGGVAVELRNASGPRAATRTTSVQLEGVEAFALDAGCTGTPVTSTLIAFESSASVPLSLRFGAPGRATVTASAAGLTSASTTVAVDSGPLASLELTGAPANVVAGTCIGPLTVRLLDAHGYAAAARGLQTVALETQPGAATGSFFGDAACATPPISQLQVAAGQASGTFWLRLTRAASTTVRATTSGRSATASLAVGPAPASRLAFVNAPLGLRTTDTCSSERGAVLRLEVHDDYGNRTTTPAAFSAAPAASPSLTLQFFDAATGQCASPVAAVTFGAGSSEAALLVRGDRVGSGTVTVTPLNGLRAATQALTVGAGDPTRLVFTTGNQTPVAGECTAAETVLEVQDATHAPSSFATDRTVALSTIPATTDPAFHFYGQPGCPPGSVLGTLTLPAGETQVRFYFRGEQRASFDVRASASGVAAATLSGNEVRAGPPAALSWTAPATPRAVAGTCSPSYGLRVVDAFANLTSFASANPLTLSSSPPGLTFDTVAGSCQALGALSLPAATSLVTAQARGTDAGTYLLSASAGGVSTLHPTSLTVEPAAPILSVTPAGPLTMVAGQCLGLTFSRADAFGNPVPAAPGGETVLFSVPSADVTVHASAQDCDAGTSPTSALPVTTGHVRSGWVRSTRAAADAGVLGASFGAASTSVPLRVTPGPTRHLIFVELPMTRTAGVCSGALTLRREDAWGNATTNGTLNATVSGPGLSVSPGAACAGGVASVSFQPNASTSSTFSVRGSDAGVWSLTATAAGGAVTGTGAFTVTPGPADSLAYLTATRTLHVDECSGDVAIEARDASGNPTVPGPPLTVQLLESPSGGAIFFEGTACTGGAVSSLTMSQSIAHFSFMPTVAPVGLWIEARPDTPSVATTSQHWTIALPDGGTFLP